jgi:hypothetical protein
MTRAAENYTWVAEDLPGLPVGQTRHSLLILRLEIYYLRGMRHAVRTVSAFGRGNSGRIAESRDVLNTQLDLLERAIRRVDDRLAALPSRNGNFDIPKRSVLELLVHACYEGLAQNHRPKTLRKSPSFKGLPVG